MDFQKLLRVTTKLSVPIPNVIFAVIILTAFVDQCPGEDAMLTKTNLCALLGKYWRSDQNHAMAVPTYAKEKSVHMFGVT